MNTLVRISTVIACLAPLTALAHPGHADGAPLVHALAHGLFYLATVISVAILATQALRRGLLRKRKQTGRCDLHRQ